MLTRSLTAVLLMLACPCVSSVNSSSPEQCNYTEMRVSDHAMKDNIWNHFWVITSAREQSYLSTAFYHKVADEVQVDSQLLRKLVRYGLYFNGKSIYRHQVQSRYPHYSPNKIDSDLNALEHAGLIAKQETHHTVTRFGTLTLAFFVAERRKLGTYMPNHAGQALTKVTGAFDALLGKDGSAYQARRHNRFRVASKSDDRDHDFDLFLDLLAARNLVSHSRFEQMEKNAKTTNLLLSPLSQEALDGVTRGWLTNKKMCAERPAWGQTIQSCQAAFDNLVRLQLIADDGQGSFSATDSGSLLNKQANERADIRFYSAFDALSHSEYCILKNYIYSAIEG